MGNLKSLSQTLIDLGFFCALGTVEAEGDKVICGVPGTRDYNNGVHVVYDEQGRPWILQGRGMTDAKKAELSSYNLGWGAYVPHSNDGGHFVHEKLG